MFFFSWKLIIVVEVNSVFMLFYCFFDVGVFFVKKKVDKDKRGLLCEKHHFKGIFYAIIILIQREGEGMNEI